MPILHVVIVWFTSPALFVFPAYFGVNCLFCFCSRDPISKVSLLTQNLTSDCNSDCVCQNSVYSPVCGGNSVTYFSACHAGCRLSPNGTIEVGKARGLKQGGGVSGAVFGGKGRGVDSATYTLKMFVGAIKPKSLSKLKYDNIIF